MQRVRKSAVILDFDGVICDSIEECLVVSYNAYSLFTQKDKYPVFDAGIIQDDFKEKFKKFRPSVRIAKEYYLLWNLIYNGSDVDIYRPLREQVNTKDGELDRYHDIFYKTRARWRNENSQSWLTSNIVFPEVTDIFSNNLSLNRLYIISAKDKASIESIFKYNNILFNNDNILGSETGFDKADLINKLIRDKYLDQCQLFFIDDNVTNLKYAKELRLNIAFASWGYNFAYEREYAINIGAEVISLDGFHLWFKRVLG